MAVVRRVFSIVVAGLALIPTLTEVPAQAAVAALGRLEVVSSAHLSPDPQRYAANIPGTVMETTYLAEDGAGSPLPNTTLNLSVDHGFFTPPCTDGSGQTSYDFCSTKSDVAGDLVSLGQATTAASDSSGRFTVATSIGRDPALDRDGSLLSTVAADDGGPSVGSAPVPWTTDAAPLNGSDLVIHGVSRALTSAQPTNQPMTAPLIVDVLVTDQFGNLTSLGNLPQTTLTTQGLGTLRRCTDPRAANGCGPTDERLAQWRGSYLNLLRADGTPAQDRFAARSEIQTGVDECGQATHTIGAQQISAGAVVPETTRDPQGGWRESTSSISTSTQIKYYVANTRPTAIFATTPANRVKAGRTVTVTATIKDALGFPRPGLSIKVTQVATPHSHCAIARARLTTDSKGRAQTTLMCRRRGSTLVTLVVTTCTGTEVARGKQTVTFAARRPRY